MVLMKVQRIAADQRRKPLVILTDQDETLILPILVGLNEAMAIYFELTKHKPPRPMTHDLIANMLQQLGLSVENVVIHRFHENTYYALLNLQRGDKRYEIDARPSDAIAVALRVRAPVYVDAQLLHAHAYRASEVSFGGPEESAGEEGVADRFREILEDVDLDLDE